MENTIKITAKTGTYIGKTRDNLREFLGIEYSKPVGFWEHPSQPTTTSEDEIEALNYGPACLQPYDIGEPASLGIVSGNANDCLNLNIWTKNNDDKGKPVMFYMHGGSYVSGGGNDPITCGANLINLLPDGEDAVVITISYRLGIFGSLDLRVLEGDTSNYQDTMALFLEDELCALRWTYENVEAFGGDPENITIFGQSAGGMSVAYLMSNEEARQYIAKGIIESGIPGFGLEPNESKTEMSKELFELLGIKTIDDLLEKDDEYWKEHYMESFIPFVNRICPRTFNGKVLKETYWEDFANGCAKGIPLMIGLGSGEMDMVAKKPGDGEDGVVDATPEDVLGALYGKYRDAGFCKGQMQPLKNMEKNEAYMASGENKLKRAIDLFAAYGTGIGTYKYADAQSKHTDTYLYCWDWMPDASPLTLPKHESAFSPWGRSCHCAELPVLWDSAAIGYRYLGHWWMDYYEDQDFKDMPAEVVPRAFHEQAALTWYSFAKTGNPNNDLIPEWPKYNSETRPAMFIKPDWEVKNDWIIEDLDQLMSIEVTED